MELAAINMESKAITPVSLDNRLDAMADISVIGNKIYIPDLAGSKLLIKEIE